MDYLVYIAIFAGGLGMGILGIGIVVYAVSRSQQSTVDTQAIQENIQTNLKDQFGELSLQALSRNSEEFLKLATTALAQQTEAGSKDLGKNKELIAQTLTGMQQEMQQVEKLIKELEKDRENKFGELTSQLQQTAQQTNRLQETASQLHTALSGKQTRGQWGERMAEDILRVAGMIEGVNYLKQKKLESTGTRPDFTFLLPRNLTVNMDVKFPLDSYLRFLETENERDRDEHRKQFLKDVKGHIKAVGTRDYINPAENTVDYMLLFIPNEQVYGFIQESDQALLDESLKQKVILCSPITLFAILAIIRQAVDNFQMERTSAEILTLLGTFKKQWESFTGQMEKMGRRIDDARKEYEALNTTRRNQLERPLRQIDELRQQREIGTTKAAIEKIPDNPT